MVGPVRSGGWLARLGLGAMALWLGTVAMARAEAPKDFASWLSGLRTDALAHGVSRATVDQTLTTIAPIARVLELDRQQPEFTMTFADYLGHVVNPERVGNGQAMFEANRVLLGQISRRYGIPPRVVVAMWGIETDYGRLTGTYSIIPALATLAYDGRRSQYFRTELINALRIVDAGISPDVLRGSWAGAMGQCQFMPSTYLKYARSWSGEGAADIWRTRADVFASTANYLHEIGWVPGAGWGRAVKLPEKPLPASLFGLGVKKTLKEWSRLGVRLPDGKPLPIRSNLKASLIRAETGKGEDVGRGDPYLVYDNFRVFMKWNHSIFFGLAAGTLADRLASK